MFNNFSITYRLNFIFKCDLITLDSCFAFKYDKYKVIIALDIANELNDYINKSRQEWCSLGIPFHCRFANYNESNTK